jgi:cytochrome c oxidase subunit 2
MFEGPTGYVETVDLVMLYIVGISVILLLGVTATMVYFVFKYHRRHGHKPKDIHGSILLETIWIAIPTVLVLSMFYFGYIGYSDLRNIPDDAMEIDVTARMWEWDFNYDNGKQTDTLYVPLGKPIKLLMKSVDVNHSFYVPAFRIKEDVIAGRENFLGFTADKVGDFDVACAEYCGLNHSMMYTKVVVMPNDEFDAWYKSKDEVKNLAESEAKDVK